MIRTQPLAMVTGPSGVGKSSLVAAGLQPALEEDGWVAATFRPGASPYESVARALLDLEHPDTAPTLQRLDTMTASLRGEGFWKVAERLTILTHKRLTLIGDQFEEVFSGGVHAEEQLSFLQHLLPLPDFLPSVNVRLVCTLRADFLPDLLALPEVGSRLQDRQLNVSPLDEEGLTRVIVEPARQAGVAFTPGLAETIAKEASKSAGSLPLLEFALTELWPLQRERHISFDSYHNVDGVAGALNRHAEKVYAFLSQQFPESRIRRVLLSMVRARGGAASAVRVTAHRDHLGSDWYIAQLLAQPEHRLVVIGPGGADTAEIAHEALIREWKRLAGWVDEDADFQQWLAVVEERAREEDLLSATRVAEAQRWLGERPADIPEAVKKLVEHSSSEILKQQQTQEMLSQSQELTEHLRERSAELERQAAELVRQNRAIELRHLETEEARQVLEERAEQLAVSMRYKSDFLTNMSHELRSPLNSLLILAKLLADNHGGNLTPKQLEFAETIHGAGSDLLQLINDILDLSKVEAGKMDVLPTRFALVQLADYVEATFRPLTDEKKLDFTVEVSPALPATLYTDEQRLLQVLRNLLANALKFTNEGTVGLRIQPGGAQLPHSIRELMLEAGTLREPDDEVIAFSVTDTGIGIEPDKTKMIFEAFKQVDAKANHRYGGTGLGLSISRETARLLGGDISVSSLPGSGSTFTLYLPLHPADQAANGHRPQKADPGHQRQGAVHTQPALAERGPGRKMWPMTGDRTDTRSFSFRDERVLVVDDDIRNVFAVTTVLENHGLAVLYAENGREAIEVLEQNHHVKAVLMDIAMPEMDGYETMRVLRQMPRFAHLPIIVLTAKAMKGDREKVLEAGASDYLAKPVAPDHLLDMLQRWVRKT
jgi:signal transduction histidine kinase/ActR/RegA family two-component response regulator